MGNELTATSTSPKVQPAVADQDSKLLEELTGRGRLVSNVVFSWAAHCVFIVAGFILPRMIDRRLGQDVLGVWDFAWSLVSYVALVQMGISSSVNRYVARYRAAGDTFRLNSLVSSACCILGIAGTLALGLTIAFSLLVPRLFAARLGENVIDTQWVVFFLGSSIACEMAFAPFSGVLTGCHRWKLHNVIKSGWHAATIAGMIIALLQGGGLRSLAAITCTGMVLACATRVILAHRACEGLRLRLSLVGLVMIRKLFVFGGKSLIPSISNLVLNQTTSILIVAYLGPGALALYARPRSLIRHVNMLVNKMSVTLTPTVGSLQSIGEKKEIRELAIKSVRYSFYMVLPMVLVIAFFGGTILQLWMGPSYANDILPAILALGYVSTLSQRPLLSILAGMNAHGRPVIAQLIASLCSIGLVALALGPFEKGLVGAAIAITVPLTLINLVYLPIYGCRILDLRIGAYFYNTMCGPLLCVAPFGICLFATRVIFANELLKALAYGLVVGGIAMIPLYWRIAIPTSLRNHIRRSIGNI